MSNTSDAFAVRDVSQTRALGARDVAIANWRAERELSRADATVVYAATHARGARGALKVSSREGTDVEARFAREIALSEIASTAGSARVLGYGVTDDGARYLVTELLEGATLAEHAERHGGRFDLITTLQLARHVVLAVQRLHLLGVLHRDLSPENVFITDDAKVKLLDFSASIREGALLPGDERPLEGDFAAPFAERDPTDPRCDVYGVAALARWMLTGRATGDDEELVNLPDDVFDFLAIGGADEPAERYPGIVAMRAALLDLLRMHSWLGVIVEEAS